MSEYYLVNFHTYRIVLSLETLKRINGRPGAHVAVAVDYTGTLCNLFSALLHLLQPVSTRLAILF
jgi:hypothetical protein